MTAERRLTMFLVSPRLPPVVFVYQVYYKQMQSGVSKDEDLLLFSFFCPSFLPITSVWGVPKLYTFGPEYRNLHQSAPSS